MSQLEDALTAAEAGDKNTAYVILADLLKTAPNNVDAWVALSGIVDDEKQKRTFLTRALTLQSDHSQALALLRQLDSPPAAEPDIVVESPVVDETSEQAAAADVVAAEPDALEPGAEVEPDPLPEIIEPAVIPGLEDTAYLSAEDMAALHQRLEPEPDHTVVAPRPVSQAAEDFEAQASGETIPPWLMGEGGEVIPESEAIASALEPEQALAEDLAPEVPDWLQDELADSWEDEPELVVPAEEPPAPAKIASAAPAPVPPKKAATPKRSKQQLDRMFRWLFFAFIIVGVVALYFLLRVVTEYNLF